MRDYTLPAPKDGVNEFPDDYRDYCDEQDRLAGWQNDEYFWEQLEKHYRALGWL